MKRNSFEEMPCSIARSLEVVGQAWALLIIREILFGENVRFDGLQAALGIARNTLTSRLNELTADEILQKIPTQERADRYEYRLTAKGRDLYPILLSLLQWGDKWRKNNQRQTPAQITHIPCGNELQAEWRCAYCGKDVRPEDLKTVANTDCSSPS